MQILRNLLNTTLTTTRTFLSSSTINAHPNLLHLTLATRGYTIQSQTLYIPNRLGFFSPGPPRLQVRQAWLFGMMAFATAFIIGYSVLAVLLMCVWGVERDVFRKVVLGLVVVTVAQVVAVWGMVCCDLRRVEGYVWRDRKVRVE